MFPPPVRLVSSRTPMWRAARVRARPHEQPNGIASDNNAKRRCPSPTTCRIAASADAPRSSETSDADDARRWQVYVSLSTGTGALPIPPPSATIKPSTLALKHQARSPPPQGRAPAPRWRTICVGARTGRERLDDSAVHAPRPGCARESPRECAPHQHLR